MTNSDKYYYAITITGCHSHEWQITWLREKKYINLDTHLKLTKLINPKVWAYDEILLINLIYKILIKNAPK